VAGIRLVQAAYQNRSLCLCTRLGFQTRAPLSVMQGKALDLRFPGYEVRQATRADIAACNALCRGVHGFDRGGELADAIGAGTAVVVGHLGRITGYATSIGFFAHAVAGEQPGFEDFDRGRDRVSRAGVPAADAERRGVRVVPGQWAEAGDAGDITHRSAIMTTRHTWKTVRATR
jgi:hypothetical protein